MEKYEKFVREADGTLTYPPGWSADNLTGSWRTIRPVLDHDKCTQCALCWVFCPDGAIERQSFAIDLRYCKGCGVCAKECKPGAIEMVREPDGEQP